MTPKAPACRHRVLDDGIQEFVLTQVSRHAVDELFDITEVLLSDVAKDANADLGAPVLIDSSVGLQALNHTMTRMRGLVNKFPARKQARIAIILPSTPLLRTIAMMMRPFATIRLYGAHEREAAIGWLRESVPAKR